MGLVLPPDSWRCSTLCWSGRCFGGGFNPTGHEGRLLLCLGLSGAHPVAVLFVYSGRRLLRANHLLLQTEWIALTRLDELNMDAGALPIQGDLLDLELTISESGLVAGNLEPRNSRHLDYISDLCPI